MESNRVGDGASFNQPQHPVRSRPLLGVESEKSEPLLSADHLQLRTPLRSSAYFVTPRCVGTWNMKANRKGSMLAYLLIYAHKALGSVPRKPSPTLSGLSSDVVASS